MRSCLFVLFVCWERFLFVRLFVCLFLVYFRFILWTFCEFMFIYSINVENPCLQMGTEWHLFVIAVEINSIQYSVDCDCAFSTTSAAFLIGWISVGQHWNLDGTHCFNLIWNNHCIHGSNVNFWQTPFIARTCWDYSRMLLHEYWNVTSRCHIWSFGIVWKF